MTCEKAYYHLRLGVGRVLEPILKWHLDRAKCECIDGVTLCNWEEKTSPDGFLRITREALSLIKSWDARRYRRVCQNLGYIVNSKMPLAMGGFIPDLKVCFVAYDKHFTTQDSEWNLRMYACTLIHEATHGLIERRSIPYYRENRKRIERLCHLEEFGFIMRIDPVWAEMHISPYLRAGVDKKD